MDSAAEGMWAWQVRHPGPIHSAPNPHGPNHPGPISFERIPVPQPGADEVLVRVLACGVCRTDLHVSEGDLPVHRPGVVPGHEIVGEVVAVGRAVAEHCVGDRVGIPWLRSTCGRCRFCRRGDENLCESSTYTGWDFDGGYAEFACAPSAFTLPLPGGYTDAELAPLLCAGIIGFRALRCAELPEGGALGIYGFGASAHLAAQVAMAGGAQVHVMTRSADARRLALELGAASAQDAADRPPVPLDAAILFAPVGTLVPPALEALDAGATLSIAGIHLTDVPPLNYQRHLFRERRIRSVTANTRENARDFLTVAAEHHLEVTATPHPLDRALQTLQDLADDKVTGAAVLIP